MDRRGLHVLSSDGSNVIESIAFANYDRVLAEKDQINIHSDTGNDIMFASKYSKDIVKSIEAMTDRLLQTSRWVMSTENSIPPPDDTELLAMESGDIIQILEGKIDLDDWLHGRNESLVGTPHGWLKRSSVTVLLDKPTTIEQRNSIRGFCRASSVMSTESQLPSLPDLGRKTSNEFPKSPQSPTLPAVEMYTKNPIFEEVPGLLSWALKHIKVPEKKKALGSISGTIKRLVNTEGPGKDAKQEISKLRNLLSFSDVRD